MAKWNSDEDLKLFGKNHHGEIEDDGFITVYHSGQKHPFIRAPARIKKVKVIKSSGHGTSEVKSERVSLSRAPWEEDND